MLSEITEYDVDGQRARSLACGGQAKEQDHPLLGCRVGGGQAGCAASRHAARRVRPRNGSGASEESRERRRRAAARSAGRADVPLHLVPCDGEARRDDPRGPAGRDRRAGRRSPWLARQAA